MMMMKYISGMILIGSRNFFYYVNYCHYFIKYVLIRVILLQRYLRSTLHSQSDKGIMCCFIY